MTSPHDQVRERVIEELDILGMPPRRELLALTELAAKCAQVPMATINVITTTEQWQVATYGFEGGVCAREDSLCPAVLEEKRPILVSDVTTDDRFADHPQVTGELGAFRFYASHPLRTPDGILIGTLCVFDEVAHPVDPELETALSTLAEQVVDVLQFELTSRRLSAANERLGAFAGQVSHDLKNPLAAIRMSVELAREETDDDGVARLLERAESGARRMDTMIGELLAFARGGAAPDRVEVDLSHELATILDDLVDAGAAERVTAGELPVLRGDPVQLRTVLENLVANALKFSGPDAPVLVNGERLEGGWWVGVADRGPGIAPEDRERVFEPMVRLDRSRSGSGIGLATCRRIVAAHGGRVAIADNPGGGSVVWFELPD